MKPKQHNPGGTLEEQAGYWVLNQHSQQWTPAQERELQAWLEQGDSHRHEYARALALWQRLDKFKSVSFPARQAAQRQRAKYLHRRQRIRTSFRAVVGAATAVVLAIGINDQLSISRYHTEKGQQQVVTLADGSQINLNTDTELKVKVTDNQRIVNIAHGEAFFTVTHDAGRPFEVIAANGRIRDIGTRFNVYKSNDFTQVTVTEGEVEIATHEEYDSANAANPQKRWVEKLLTSVRHWLPISDFETRPGIHVTAGQQLAYNSLGEPGRLTKADTSRVTAWRGGRLIFDLAPLAEVMAQIARYHPVEFQFADARLAKIKVTASFDTSNLPLILSTLQATFPFKAQWLDGRRVKIAAATRH